MRRSILLGLSLAGLQACGPSAAVLPQPHLYVSPFARVQVQHDTLALLDSLIQVEHERLAMRPRDGQDSSIAPQATADIPAVSNFEVSPEDIGFYSGGPFALPPVRVEVVPEVLAPIASESVLDSVVVAFLRGDVLDADVLALADSYGWDVVDKALTRALEAAPTHGPESATADAADEPLSSAREMPRTLDPIDTRGPSIHEIIVDETAVAPATPRTAGPSATDLATRLAELGLSLPALPVSMPAVHYSHPTSPTSPPAESLGAVRPADARYLRPQTSVLPLPTTAVLSARQPIHTLVLHVTPEMRRPWLETATIRTGLDEVSTWFANESGGLSVLSFDVFEPRIVRTARASDAAALTTPDLRDITRKVLESWASEMPLGLYDNDGPDGVAYSGDDDGRIDLTIVVVESESDLPTLTTPVDVILGAGGRGSRNVRPGPVIFVPASSTSDAGQIATFVRKAITSQMGLLPSMAIATDPEGPITTSVAQASLGWKRVARIEDVGFYRIEGSTTMFFLPVDADNDERGTLIDVRRGVINVDDVFLGPHDPVSLNSRTLSADDGESLSIRVRGVTLQGRLWSEDGGIFLDLTR